MKLIFLLFLNLFHKFAVHGDGVTQNEVIDTNELDECDQVLIANLTDVPLRYKIKRAFWDKVQQKNNLIKLLEERDHRLNNSFLNDILCAMNQIQVTLEECYPGNLNQTFSPIHESFPEAYIAKPADAYTYLLISRDHKWVPQYNKERFKKISLMNYFDKIERFKRTWLHYLCSKEGRALAERIAPANFEEREREIILTRFSYDMSRLFVIARAFRPKLLNALEQKIREDPTKSLLTHFRKLVKLWSCTYDQMKFHDKLARFRYPKSHRLNVAMFGNDTINGHEVIFVVPHTKEDCGFRTGDEIDLLLGK